MRFRQGEQHVEGRGARQGKYTIGGMGIQHQVKRSGGTRGEGYPSPSRRMSSDRSCRSGREEKRRGGDLRNLDRTQQGPEPRKVDDLPQVGHSR